MDFEEIFPGICLSLYENIWTKEKIHLNRFTHIIRIDGHILKNDHNYKFTNTTNLISSGDTTDFSEFEMLDLNFGESSYLTTVLPNCYKGVKFIDKALKSDGSVLIIDQINNEKCITVVVGYLMYKKHIRFR